MQKVLSAFTFVLLIACESQDSINSSKKTQETGETPKPTRPTIKLYAVDPIFYKYMPDTNLVFRHPDSLREYMLSTDKSFYNFRDSLRKNTAELDSTILMIKQAEILYADLNEASMMKNYKVWKRDNRSMGMLGFFSPNSRLISLEERMTFFKSFPKDIQNNDVGKKTLKRLEEYSFTKNIPSNMRRFDQIEVIDTNNHHKTVSSFFVPHYKYYIFVLGASWCSPCRIEEKQLKYWINSIDTSQIRIVGFSVDKNFQKWKRSLEEDKLPWQCYLLQGEWANPIFKELQIESIPRNLLIDNSGKVLLENTDIRKILKQIPIVPTE